MRGERLIHTLRLFCFRSDKKRSKYLKEKQVFYRMGENVSLNMKVLPLYAKLISFGNNIKVATGVTFITHDVMHMVFNNCSDYKYAENIGCIDIRDNCFIGAKAIIMPGVRIGPDSIIAAGAVVTHDVPAGEIWGGCPAKRIGYFNDYLKKYKSICEVKKKFARSHAETISSERIEQEWEFFHKQHQAGHGSKKE